MKTDMLTIHMGTNEVCAQLVLVLSAFAAHHLSKYMDGEISEHLKGGQE